MHLYQKIQIARGDISKKDMAKTLGISWNQYHLYEIQNLINLSFLNHKSFLKVYNKQSIISYCQNNESQLKISCKETIKNYNKNKNKNNRNNCRFKMG